MKGTPNKDAVTRTDRLCVSAAGVSIGYNRPIIAGINLRVNAGEYWGIIGPNGAGKTTLFKTILGLIPPLKGKIESHLPPPGRIAYVPQQSTLKTHLPVSVRDLILMPLQSALPWQKPSRENLQRLEHFADRLKISRLLDKQVAQISGGEKQKSLICRALMMQSPVLLLDEPTNGMDIGSEKEILMLIKKLNR